MKRMRIDPAQLGAIPCWDASDCWLLSNSDKQEMTIACTDADNEMFATTVKVTKLLPDAQAYQLAAALMLNKDPRNLNGGAVAYDVDDDSFLYCKRIDARMLSLSSFSNQVKEGFATAQMLRELLLHAQKDIGPMKNLMKTSSTMNLLINRKSS